MKTTNFEISKKLKEAGFDAQSSFFWCELGKDLIKIHISQSHSVPESIDKIKAYDLETLLDALPDSITREYKSNKDGTIREFEEELVIEKNKIWYNCYDIETSDEANEYWREYGYEHNKIIALQFYRDTPIGSYSIYHYDLEMALDKALDILNNFNK